VVITGELSGFLRNRSVTVQIFCTCQVVEKRWE